MMFKKIIIFLLSLLICLQISPILSQSLNQPKNQIQIRRLQQQSQANYEQGNFSEAAQNLQELIQFFTQQGDKQNLAKTWTNLGHLQFAWGKLEAAIASWQEAAKIEQQLNQETAVSYLQVYQAEALQKLGLYPRACQTLTQALNINTQFCQDQKITQNNNQLLQEISNKIQVNSQLSLDGFRILGDVLVKVGRLEEATILLKQIASLSDNSSINLSLGNTFRAMGNLTRDRQAEAKYNYVPWQCDFIAIPQEAENNYHQAIQYYQKAANNSPLTLQTKARLNQFSLLVNMNLKEEYKEAKNLSNILAIDLPKLPLNYTKIYAEISYAKNLACLQQQQNALAPTEIIPLLENAITEAKQLEETADLDKSQSTKIQPKILESYAVGNLGGFYEYLSLTDPQQAATYRQKALQLTQEALYLAQPNEAAHIAYQWQWQLGRLFQAYNNQEEALKNYELATQTLDTVRGDLLTINSDVQFSFRDNVEPLYRGLVNLILSVENTQYSQEKLEKSLYYIESLQLADLENFLRCNLKETKNIPTQISNSNFLLKHINQVVPENSKAALIYPLILPDHLAVIIKLPGQDKLLYHSKLISQEEVNKTLKQLRYIILPKGNFYEPEDKELLTEVYKWLIEPFEDDLTTAQIHTLIFILDGAFRDVPMATLHNGKDFLIKNYAITLVPSIQLLNLQSVETNQIKALVSGVSKPRKDLGFPEELYSVPVEINLVAQQFINPKVIPEANFTKDILQNELDSSSYNLIHLATHGKFSSNLEETFILTSDPQPLQFNQFSNLLLTNFSNQLYLLFLSACQTATGDRRAVLGLAGLAVRSGANSTIASLWTVDDEATKVFVEKFYENLVKHGVKQVSSAEALRLAQQAMLKDSNYNSPRYWAPFVIVGTSR